MQYSRFVESRLFLASLNAMNSFCALSISYDFSDERWPLRTAYMAAYTCSRTFDTRPLDNLARIAGNCLVQSTQPLDPWDQFCLDYILVAARLDNPACLRPYFVLPGRSGIIAAVRSASLGYFLGDISLLVASTERIEAAKEHEWVWEKYNAEALLSIMRRSTPDLPRLCRSLTDSPLDLRPYFALDMYLLMREMQPSLRPRLSSLDF